MPTAKRKPQKERRRGRNEGSIYQRASDGRWVASVSVGTDTQGKKVRRTLYAATYDEAVALRNEMVRQRDAGVMPAPSRLTVADYARIWLRDVVQPYKRPATYESYNYLTTQYILPALGKYPLTKLSTPQVQAFITRIHKQGGGKRAERPSRRTLQYLRDLVRIMYNHARKQGLVERNPAEGVVLPADDTQERPYFDREQARAFLAAIAGDDLEALVTVTLLLGLRRGEALGLRWEDIDFEARTVRVGGSLQRVGGSLQRLGTKTVESNRTLDMLPLVESALRAHRTRQKVEKARYRDRWQDTGYVFTARYGTPMEPRNLSRRFTVLLRRLGLPHMHFHDLRHSQATILGELGVDIAIISKLLGHADPRTTATLYRHVTKGEKRRALGALDDAFGSG